jgi:hypothetical protein
MLAIDAVARSCIATRLFVQSRTGWLIKEIIDLKLTSGEILKVDGTLTVTGK